MSADQAKRKVRAPGKKRRFEPFTFTLNDENFTVELPPRFVDCYETVDPPLSEDCPTAFDRRYPLYDRLLFVRVFEFVGDRQTIKIHFIQSGTRCQSFDRLIVPSAAPGVYHDAYMIRKNRHARVYRIDITPTEESHKGAIFVARKLAASLDQTGAGKRSPLQDLPCATVRNDWRTIVLLGGPTLEFGKRRMRGQSLKAIWAFCEKHDTAKFSWEDVRTTANEAGVVGCSTGRRLLHDVFGGEQSIDRLLSRDTGDSAKAEAYNLRVRFVVD